MSFVSTWGIATNTNVPIWLGESGENSDDWVAAFVRTLESESVGWCFWPYKKMDQTSSVVTFAKPAHWDQIVAYAKLAGGVGAGRRKRIQAFARERQGCDGRSAASRSSSRTGGRTMATYARSA